MIYGNITNCSVVGHGTISAYECRLGYEVISEDTSTNTREIKLQLEARTVSNRYATIGWQLTPTIDGVEVTPISMNFTVANVNVWQILGSRIITIQGAFKGIKIGSFTTNIPDEWGLKSGSASVTIELDDLHTPPVITTITTSEKNTLLNNAYQFVQYLSIKELEFEVTTYDDATISSYQVHHNGSLIGSNTSNKVTIDFNNVGTLSTFEMDGKTWCTLKFVVIDSYGTVGSSEVPYEVIKYTRPNLVQTSSSIKRNGQLTGKVKLNLIGTFFEQAVNGINNTISLKYAYWKKGDNESTTYYNIPFTATDNSITLYDWNVAKGNTEITDVSKDYAYYFKIKATDYFNRTSEITLLCPVGEYLWAEFKDRVDFKNITIQKQKILTETVLFEGIQATGTITLNDSVANYQYIEIFYENSTLYYSTKVYSPNNKNIGLMSASVEQELLQIDNVYVTVKEKTITIGTGRRTNNGPAGNATWNANNQYIYRIVGYK